MGLRLGDQDGYPAGVDSSHPNFHDEARTRSVSDEKHCGMFFYRLFHPRFGSNQFQTLLGAARLSRLKF